MNEAQRQRKGAGIARDSRLFLIFYEKNYFFRLLLKFYVTKREFSRLIYESRRR